MAKPVFHAEAFANEGSAPFRFSGGLYEFDLSGVPEREWARGGEAEFTRPESYEFARAFGRQQVDGFYDSVAQMLRGAKEPGYRHEFNAFEDSARAKRISKELVTLVAGLISHADGEKHRRYAELGPERGQVEFNKQVDQNEIVFERPTGKAKLNTVDGNRFIQVSHTETGISFLILNGETVSPTSTHLKQIVSRKIVDSNRDAVEVWLDREDRERIVKETRLQPRPASRGQKALRYYHATVQRPDLGASFVTGLIFGAAQFVMAAGITHGSAAMTGGSADLKAPVLSLIFGATIAAFNSTYRHWLYRGDSKAFFEKSIAVSLLFSYIYRGWKSGFFGDPIGLGTFVNSGLGVLMPKYREWMHRGSYTQFLVKFIGVSFAIGLGLDLVLPRDVAGVTVFGTIGIMANIALLVNGLISNYARDIFSRISKIRDVLRIKRGEGSDIQFRVGRLQYKEKRGTMEAQTLYLGQFVGKVAGIFPGMEVWGNVIFLGFTEVMKRINLWYAEAIQFVGKQGQLPGSREMRESWRRSPGGRLEGAFRWMLGRPRVGGGGSRCAQLFSS